MEAQRLTTSYDTEASGSATRNHDSLSLDGLEDLFKWASEMVSDGEDTRAKRIRDERLKRQVIASIQRLHENEVQMAAIQENAYLQRRLIATMQKLQEFTEEISKLKLEIASQKLDVERIPELESEIGRLKANEWDRERAKVEQQELLNGLAKLKIECDYFEELLTVNEEENARLTALLSACRKELDAIHSRRWWQFWKRWPWTVG